MGHFQLSPFQRRNIDKIVAIGLFWFLFGLVYVFLERGMLGDSAIYPSTGNPYKFSTALITTTIGAFFMGLVFGGLEVFYIDQKFARTAFGVKILLKTCIYLLVIVLLILALAFLGSSISLNVALDDVAVINAVSMFFSNTAFWCVAFYVGVVICVGLFLFEVSDNLGQGVLKNFLLGKYHKPREESRVFMFLDMKASTTIAEQLGHTRYFELLNDYYADMTESILQTSGAIYKYVGDEIIISWNTKAGFKNNNCLRCFFSIKQTLKNKAAFYNEKFGLVPEFKAGIHFGPVITGEIGVLKKEIAFNGDVLNTTARIQSLCNSCSVDLLISGELYAALDVDNAFKATAIGEMSLRGKDIKVQLYSIAWKN